MRPTRFDLLAVPLAAATLAFGAHGGAEPSASAGSGREQLREAVPEFASCMRANGVDMPRPRSHGGMVLSLRRADRATRTRADATCGQRLMALRPPELSPEERRKLRERAEKHARCLRAHGIDASDATSEGSAGVAIRLPEGGPDDPRVRAALEACRQFGPDFEKTVPRPRGAACALGSGPTRSRLAAPETW